MQVPQLSGAVMAHPRRRAEARQLVGLDPQGRCRVVLDPDPDGPPTALRTAAAAWAAVAPDATHHLVLQDDVLLAEGFFEHARAAARAAPTDAIAFYANWNSRNGAAVRTAALSGADWVWALDEYTPCVALMLPAAIAAGYAAFAAADDAGWPYDVLMFRYLRSTGTRTRITVPNTVEHSGIPSIAGNVAHGLRRSALFAPVALGSVPAVCADLPVVPFLKHGSAQCAVRTAAGWDYLEAERHLRRAGVPLESAREGFERFPGRDGLPAQAAWNTWLTAFALGTTARGVDPASAPLSDAALRTLGPGAVCDELSPAEIEALHGPLHALARAAVAVGRATVSGRDGRDGRDGAARRTDGGIGGFTAVTGLAGPFADSLSRLLGDLGHVVRQLPGPVAAGDLAGCRRLVHLSDQFAPDSGGLPASVRQVLDVAAEADVHRLVYAGTATVHGDGPVVDERFLPEPEPDAPGLRQWREEEAFRRWSAETGRPATVLRFAEPVGPHAPTGTVTARWIRLAWTRKELPLYPDRRHQVVDLRDMASAIDAALAGDHRSPVVHIASAVHDEAAWAALVSAVTRRTAHTVAAATDAAGMGAAGTGGARVQVLATGLAEARLGWKPTAPLTEGLRAQAQWLAYDTECR